MKIYHCHRSGVGNGVGTWSNTITSTNTNIMLLLPTFHHQKRQSIIMIPFMNVQQQSCNPMIRSTSTPTALSMTMLPNDIIDNIGTITASTTTTTDIVFDPIVPDDTILIGLAITFVICIIASYVWSNEVVPISRTKLALSKRNGPVRQYLEELQNNDYDYDSSSSASLSSPQPSSTRYSEIDMLGTEIISRESTTIGTEITTGSHSTTQQHSNNNIYDNNNIIDTSIKKTKNTRLFEKWLFTDWLEQAAYRNDPKNTNKKPQKESALPILKNAKWNSGDNPIVVATALILFGVILTSILERITV